MDPAPVTAITQLAAVQHVAVSVAQLRKQGVWRSGAGDG